jgi:hypothetical protein
MGGVYCTTSNFHLVPEGKRNVVRQVPTTPPRKSTLPYCLAFWPRGRADLGTRRMQLDGRDPAIPRSGRASAAPVTR